MIANYNKKQKYFIAGGILFTAVSVLLIIADINIYKNKQRLKAQIANYEKQIAEIKSKNQNLKQGIDQANNNDYIEKVAREELSLQKPGEKVVSFILPPAQQKPEAQKKNVFQNFWDSIVNIFKKFF